MHSKLSSLAFIALLATLTLTGCGGTSGSGGGGGGGNNPTTITVKFTNSPGDVAYQVGSGTYTAATLSNNTLTFSVPFGTSNFSFVYLCTQSNGTSVSSVEYVNYTTINDGTTYTTGCLNNSAQLKSGTLSGSVDTSALTNPQFIDVMTYQSGAEGIGGFPVAQEQSFSVLTLQGTDDILLTVFDNNSQLIAAREFTNQQVPGTLNNGNTVTFSAADETTTANITYNNVPVGATQNTQLFFTSASGAQYFLSPVTATYPVMPATLLTSTAKNEIQATAISPSGSVVDFLSFTNTGGPVTINYPTLWNCTAPTPAAYPTFALGSYTGFTGNSGRMLEASMAWINNQNVYDNISLDFFADALGSSSVAVPNLSSISSNYPVPTSGATAYWNEIDTVFSSGTLGSTPANSSVSTVGCNGNFIVP
jgi:hypothetical protein